MQNIDLELAIKVMVNSVEEINDIEKVKIEDSRGRLLQEDIYATINNPPFDRSPLDGYAINATDTKGASKSTPIKLKVVDEVFAGEYSDKILKNKEAIRIMTGAKIPKGANCIIRQENTNYGLEEVEIYEELNEYDNYCFEGEDIKKGEKLIPKGDKLNYIHIGVLASMGYETVLVKRRIKVAVISTGDELTPLGKPLEEGKIYDSNRRMITARLLDYGCDVVNSEAIRDNEEEIINVINKVIESVDLVITTGGVSVGKKDLMNNIVDTLGAQKIFWRVSIKPGTPAIYALYKEIPLLCLSGNPFAAIATYELLGKELLYKLTGDIDLKQLRKTAVMADDFMKSSPVRRIIRAIYKDNTVYLPEGGHSSGALGSMVGCNCLIDIKSGTKKLLKGDKVEIILLK